MCFCVYVFVCIDEFVGVVVMEGGLPYLQHALLSNATVRRQALSTLLDVSSSSQAKALVSSSLLPVLLGIVRKRCDAENSQENVDSAATEHAMLAGKILSRLGGWCFLFSFEMCQPL